MAQITLTKNDDNFLDNDVGNTILALGGDDEVRGKGGKDTIFGDADDDTLFGGRGDDVLSGGEGIDELNGGGGFDKALFRDGGGVYIGINMDRWTNFVPGAGIDVFDDGFGNQEEYESIEVFILSNKDDRFLGYFGTTDVTVNGGGGDDKIRGGDGDDTLLGGKGYDLITGGGGNDTLFGGAGNDYLESSSGNNRLDGGVGQDRLNGFGGDVDFIFANRGGGPDTIHNFNIAINKKPDHQIVIDRSGFAADFDLGKLRGDGDYFVGSAPKAQGYDDALLYDSNDGRLFFDANGESAGGRTLVAIVEGQQGFGPPEVRAIDLLIIA